MKRCTTALILLLLLTVTLIAAAGCSRFLRPTDAEALQAIEASGALKGPGFTVTSPLEIVDRGSRDDYGFWHYKVKMTLIMRKLDGGMSEPKQNTVTFKISRSKDSTGNTVWTATL